METRKHTGSIQESAREVVPPKMTPRPLLAGVRRLSWDEMQKKHEKGLCFNYDEKFTPGHKCKVKQAYLIEPVGLNDDEIEELLEVEDAKILVHAMSVVRGPKTMRINSWIKNRRVVVLIDSGSTHNFINHEIAKKLNLVASKVETFQVRVASREKLKCETLYRAVPIKIQGVTISADLYALPLEGLDVVLGVQWLEGLGRVVTDYGQGIIEFAWGDGMVTIKSGTEGDIQEVGLKSIARMWQKGGACYAIQTQKHEQHR